MLQIRVILQLDKRKCSTQGCNKEHNPSVKDLAEFCENVAIMLAFLFYRPAVRRQCIMIKLKK